MNRVSTSYDSFITLSIYTPSYTINNCKCCSSCSDTSRAGIPRQYLQPVCNRPAHCRVCHAGYHRPVVAPARIGTATTHTGTLSNSGCANLCNRNPPARDTGCGADHWLARACHYGFSEHNNNPRADNSAALSSVSRIASRDAGRVSDHNDTFPVYRSDTYSKSWRSGARSGRSLSGPLDWTARPRYTVTYPNAQDAGSGTVWR